METSPSHEDFDPDEDPPLIDFDFQTGKFNMKTIHPSLKKFFKTLGITKKDLQDKRMVPVIFDCLIRVFSELHLEKDKEELHKKPKKSCDFVEDVYSDEKTPSSAQTKQCVIKFDLKLGIFEIENLHPTLKRIFKKAKISKKDLRDKEMAITIMKAIIESFCLIHELTESKQLLESGQIFKI